MEKETILIFGLGPHSKRIYLRYFQENENYNLVIVDLLEMKTKIIEFMKNLNINYELICFDEIIRNNEVLDEKNIKVLNKIVEKYNINKAIISTEPKSHKMYIKYCLDQGINILCDKPITSCIGTNTIEGSNKILEDFESIIYEYEKSDTKIFEIMTQRRNHAGYLKVLNIVEEICLKFEVPITKIKIEHSDGNWNMPPEIIFRENHPYKYGYGKMMHSGYHFIDLLSSFIEINEKINIKMDNTHVQVSDYRPSDFYKFYNEKFYEKIKFNFDEKDFTNSDLFKNFGEFDMSSIIEYKDDNENIITTAILDLSQTGFSRRSWYTLPEDTYKGNGRVRHEFLDVTIGPLLNIKVLSFQSTEIKDGDFHLNEPGEIDHFEILVFRNSDLIGGKAFEKILVEPESFQNFYIGHNEVPRFKIIENFLNEISTFDVKKHSKSIKLLSDLYLEMSKRFCNNNFRFAVECLIKYQDKYLICKRSDDCIIAPSIWNIPAGKVKIQESFETAVHREVLEETNLTVYNPKFLKYHYINKPTHQRIVATYICEIDNIKDFKLCYKEFSEFEWVNKENIMNFDSLQEHLVQIITGDFDA